MTDDTTDIDDRLDRLEAQFEDQRATIDEQQETIEDQQEVIAEQRELIETQRERIAELESEPGGDGSDEPGSPQPVTVNRRTALKAGGLLAALGLGAGAGTASADPRGQVGTEDRPLEALYTRTLNSDGSLAVDIDSNDDETGESFQLTQDEATTPLLTVNDGGEVDIESGNLDLNNNVVTDSGSNLTLSGSSDVELAGSNLVLGDNDLVEPDQIQTGGGGSDTITVQDTNAGSAIVTFNEGGRVDINSGVMNLSNSDSIQDSGTDAIQFDGNQNVTIPNGNLNADDLTDSGSGSVSMGNSLDLNGNDLNNVASIDNGGSAISVDDALNLSNSDSIQDSGTDAVQFDGNQNVTIPNGNHSVSGHSDVGNVGLHAFSFDSMYIPNDSAETIPFERGSPDHFGGLDTSFGNAGVYTVQEAGDYHVDFMVDWLDTFAEGDYIRYSIVVNDGSDPGLNADTNVATSTDPTRHFSRTLFGLASGDTIEIEIRQTSGSKKELGTGIEGTMMTLHKVG